MYQRLLRYIDDFLLITPSLSTAERFVSRMNEGFPAYGAFVSPSKTLLSFECLGKGRMEEVFVQDDCKSCSTLQICRGHGQNRFRAAVGGPGVPARKYEQELMYRVPVLRVHDQYSDARDEYGPCTVIERTYVSLLPL